jgi:hypothetical protein
MPLTLTGSGTITGINASGGLSSPQSNTVLQVVQNEYSTQVSLSSQTYTDNGLTATITPKFATSKILVLISQNLYIYREFAFQYGNVRLLRNVPSTNTVVKDFAQVMNITTGIPAGGSYPYFDLQSVVGLSYLDSPATTSTITYKMQQKVGTTNNGGTVISQLGDYPSMMTLIEIAV